MDAVFIIGLGLLIFAIMILIINHEEHKLWLYDAAACITCVGLSFMIIAAIFVSQPTAIDVYRGKTSLEITYRDSIPVDSVVVFKK